MNATTQANQKQAVDALAVKDNEVWDDLDKIYLECRALSVQPAQVLPLLKDPAKLKLVEDPKHLVDQARVLSKDTENYNQQLELIHNKHADRRGSSSNGDEIMEAMSIGEEYRGWLHAFQVVVMPMVNSILSQFNVEEENQPTDANNGE